MDSLGGRLGQLDLSKIDIGQICLNIAESQMLDYQAHRGSENAWAYLHVAETNLMQATRQGKDTTKQYELLRTLQSE